MKLMTVEACIALSVWSGPEEVNVQRHHPLNPMFATRGVVAEDDVADPRGEQPISERSDDWTPAGGHRGAPVVVRTAVTYTT